MVHLKILSITLATSLMLAACGSEESPSTVMTAAPTVPLVSANPESTEPSWSPGVFENESQFKGRCESPRSGVDSDGNAYTDQAGSTLYEKHWLRSWSNNTYLWYSEITDNDIAVIDEPVDYFQTLKTTASTASGAAKDQFHYAQDTEDYLQLTSGGANLSYGIKFKFLKTTVPREGRIAYVEPNSPATNANLSRGAEIIAIDGVDFINGTDVATLNAGLFPQVDGEAHTFEVRDLGQATTRTITLQAEVVTNEPVKGTRLITTASGQIAYLALNTFSSSSAEAALVDAFTDLAKGTPDDLVIDLRYNGGGYLAISAQLAYMVTGSALSSGRMFEKTVFNDKHPTINPVTGGVNSSISFISSTLGFSTTSGQPLPTLNLNRVFILSSGNTCSASESLINALRGIDVDVVLIGSTTCGKPYGFYSTDNCGVTYSTIQFRGENNKGFGDYADGFSPNNTVGGPGERIKGCYVIENVLHPLGDEQESLLSAALSYRDTGTCPAVPAGRVALQGSNDLKDGSRFKQRELLEQIRMDNLRVNKR